MRILPLLSAALAAAAVTAQSPLTTTFANNNGGAAGGAVYFDLSCTSATGVSITDIELNCGGAGGVAGTIDVYLAGLGTATTAPGWTLFSQGTTAATNPVGTPTPFNLATPIEMDNGCAFRVAIVAGGFAHAYTTGGTGFPLTYTTAELTLTAGQASNVPFVGTPFSPRVVNTNIVYGNVGTSCPAFASKELYGAGCVSSFASFYEILSAANMDLSGLSVSCLNTGSGYIATVAAGSVAAIGSVGAAASLALGDDNQVVAGTLGLSVGSNGWVAFGTGNSNGFVPSAATFLGNPSEAFCAWTDLQPNAAGSGLVWYEESGTVAQVTYDGVYGWGTTAGNTIQFLVDTATGDCTITFGALATTNPENWLIGYSPAGASADPGPTDISAAALIQTFPTDIVPLSVDSTLARIGLNWDITTTNIDPISPISVTFVGDRGPALPLALIGIAAPGCDANLSSILGDLSGVSVGGTSTVTVSVPNNPTLVGAMLSAQSISLSLANAANLITSNGVEVTIGN